LQRLQLAHNNLSGTLTSELGDLSNLQRLWLRDNYLSGTLPSELGDLNKLHKLQSLELSYNRLSGTIPSELGELSKFFILRLDNNFLIANHTIQGSASNDMLYGNAGNDTLYGQNGDDILDGGRGRDMLYGNEGEDTFILAQGMDQDTIQDFSDGTDYIQLGEDLSFGDLKIASRGSSTSIEIADSGEVLAILSGIDNQQISDLDFV